MQSRRRDNGPALTIALGALGQSGLLWLRRKMRSPSLRGATVLSAAIRADRANIREKEVKKTREGYQFSWPIGHSRYADRRFILD